MNIFNTKSNSIIIHTGVTALASYHLADFFRVEILYMWLAMANIITFLSFGKDKFCAKAGFGRTPEITFHVMGILGAFPAIFIGRKAFNHKTTKQGFIIPMWIFFFLQVVSVAYLMGDFNPGSAKSPKSSQVAQKTTN